MGSIRTLLALAVVFAHTYGFVFVGPTLAVQLFYIISGFLISFVLLEANTYQRKRDFYLNRFLRLFPIYWVVALLTLLGAWVASHFLGKTPPLVQTFSAISWSGKIALAFSNLAIFGQDWLMFTGVKGGVFQFVPNFLDSEVLVFQGLLVPQAWTLGLELTFYLLAPVLLKKMRWMFLVLFVSLSVKAYLIAMGLGLKDPWSYRFFPAELSFFLLGALSHQVWRPFLMRREWISLRASKLICLLVFLYAAIFFFLPNRAFHRVLLIMLFVFSLPFYSISRRVTDGIDGWGS